MTTAALRRTDRFPGTRVVTGCFIVLAVSAGLGFYGLAVYLNAFSNERDWPVASISLATTVYFVVSGVAGLYIARIIARRDVRIPIVAGGVLGGLSLAVLGHVQERWQLYAVYAVFALGFAGAGLVPVTTVVTRWYHVRRSVALSVASTGLSAGGILLTPLAKWLIDEHGLSTSTPILGVVWVLGIVPFALWLVRPDPAALGLDARRRAGAATTCPRSSPPARRSTRPCAPASSSPPRSPTSSCSARRSAGSSSSSSSSRIAPTRARRRWRRSSLAGTSVVARLVGGRVVARLPMAGFTVGLAAVQAVALVGLAFAETKLAIFAAIILFGATIGNILMLQPLLIAERFGVLDYPRIFSRAQFITMVGVAGGPLLLGWLYDNAGGYRTSYIVAAVLLAGRRVRAGGGRSRYRAATRELTTSHPERPAGRRRRRRAPGWRSRPCASPTAPRRRPTPRRRSASTSGRSSRA